MYFSPGGRSDAVCLSAQEMKKCHQNIEPPIPSANSILRRSSRDCYKLGFLFLVILLLLFSVLVVAVVIIFRSTLITFMLTANR